MQRSAGNLQDRLQKSWTYLDVLALALAEADGRQFDTDRAKWNHLVADLQERFPRLLADIYFDRRDPETLYSEEVSDFLRFMIRSGVFENPTFRVYEMSEPTKEAVK